MDGGEAVVIDPAVFDGNLAVLREVDTPLADLLSSWRLPETVRPCRARDGSLTFRIRGDDGREHWFGGTSAPTISAPALLDGFDAGKGNVLVPGIGHGTEVAVLLQRLELHRGVLVLETDPLAFALALRLHDFQRPIRGARLVLILGAADETENRLCEFLASHDGYCCPERMLVWPWQVQASGHPLQAAVERCAAATLRQRMIELAEVEARWRTGRPAESPATPRVAVVSRTATPTSSQWAQQAAGGGRQLGWVTEAFAVRGPSDCHILSLAKCLETFRPDWVLAVGSTRGAISSAVSPSLPIVSWLDLASIGGGLSSAGVGLNDAVVVTSAVARDRLAVDVVPTPCVPVVPRPAVCRDGYSGPVEGERLYDVVLMLDVIPADPQDAGVKLHTQQVLWRESAAIIRREVDSFISARADAVVKAAEGRVKMAIREPALRSAFVQLIAEAVGPSVVAVELVRRLVGAGIAVHVWGSGWGSYSIAGVHHHGVLPCSEDAHVTLCRTEAYVCSGVLGEVGRDVFDAVLAGAVVVWRRHPADADAGGMDSLFADGREFVAFRTGAELVRTCEGLLADRSTVSRIRDAAYRRASQEHTMVERLRAIQTLVGHAKKQD